MRGFITEKNWKDIDKVFVGLHRFYRHLSRKPRTFLDLLELYWKRQSLKRVHSVLLLAALSLSFGSVSAQDAAAPEAAEEPLPPRATLKLAGACDVNKAESAVLHLKGIIAVDIESKKEHLLVDYTSNAVTPQQMADAIARKAGCMAHVIGAGGTGGATVK